MSNKTEYGAGEFPLPTRPPAGTAVQSTSKTLSIIRSQQNEEAYPDLKKLMRELERAQRERDKANLDRDGAILEREQANLHLNLIKAEHEQAQRLRENTAICEQIRSEIEKIQGDTQ